MTENKQSHVLGAPVQTRRTSRRQQKLKPSQISSNDVNDQDDRHEVERPTDSSVVATTHSLSLSDSEISHRDNDNSEQEVDSGQEKLSDNNHSLGIHNSQ